MIGVSSGIIELRGRYGVAQLRADAPADLVARLRELLEGADGADGGPGRGAARAPAAPPGRYWPPCGQPPQRRERSAEPLPSQ